MCVGLGGECVQHGRGYDGGQFTAHVHRGCQGGQTGHGWGQGRLLHHQGHFRILQEGRKQCTIPR